MSLSTAASESATGLNLRLLYDHTLLRYDGATPGELLDASHSLETHSPEGGSVNVLVHDPSGAGTPFSAAEGAVCNLTFTILPAASLGTVIPVVFASDMDTSPALPASGLSSPDGVSIAHTRIEGSITVETADTPTPSPTPGEDTPTPTETPFEQATPTETSIPEATPTETPTAEGPTPTPSETPTPSPSPDCEGIECVVIHFYTEILKRQPSQGEVDAWSVGYFDWLMQEDLDVRFVPSEMGRQFFLSDEYGALATDAPTFVTDNYSAFLYRDPSQVELDNWGDPPNRKETISIFANSDEFRDRIASMFPDMEGNPTRNFVATMYLGLLDRLPDPGGLAFYADEFDAAANKRDRARQMGREVTAAQEYLEKRSTDDLRVESMYRAYLGRYPNNSELLYWSDQLSSGTHTLEEVMEAFADSQEFTNRLNTYFGG